MAEVLPVLEVRNLSKRFGALAASDDVSLDLRIGEIHALIGPNGAGKSTLLGILCGEIPADAGEFRLPAAISWVPQEGGVDDHLTAEEHYRFFGAALGMTAGAAVAEGRRLADEIGWRAGDSRRPLGELSGGTRRKVAIVTALLGASDLVVMDEPYQGLDSESTARFWDLMWTERDAGRTFVVSTHQPDVLHRADRIVEVGR